MALKMSIIDELIPKTESNDDKNLLITQEYFVLLFRELLIEFS